MSTSLQVTNLGKGFNSPLFSGVTLGARSSCVIGLIGDNGCGKSTFLKILAGMEEAGEGEILWSSNCRIGYLEQEIISETYDLSGGEKKILKLTELFYSNYNVLLLDEADNHLDLDHKLWFENLVKEFEGIIIVISHDRAFLANATDKIWLVEEKTIREYSFGYKKFKEIYLEEMKSRQHLWEVQEKERVRLLDIVRRLRIQAEANDKLTGRYHSAEKRYARFVEEMVEKPPADRKIKLAIDLNKQHKRKTAFHLKNVTKVLGGKVVINNLDLHIFCADKVSISAPNGAGKSTLLNIISGRLAPDGGLVRVGDGLSVGYYTQEHLQALNEKATLVEELQRSMSFPYYDAIAYLKRFLFSEDQANSQVRLLSGGQKSRLQLAKFLATNPEILVLDEPTNHLDIKTVTSLELFLKDYEGTLVLVSHDRELVQNVVEIQYQLTNGRLSQAEFLKHN